MGKLSISRLCGILRRYGAFPPVAPSDGIVAAFRIFFNQKAFLLLFPFLISLPLASCDAALTDKVQIAPKYPEIRDEAKDDG